MQGLGATAIPLHVLLVLLVPANKVIPSVRLSACIFASNTMQKYFTAKPHVEPVDEDIKPAAGAVAIAISPPEPLAAALEELPTTERRQTMCGFELVPLAEFSVIFPYFQYNNVCCL
jgi:hypothetical protein